MNTKIMGILIFILLIATTVPSTESLQNNAINITIQNTPLKNRAANWTEMQKLIASDGAEGDNFGCYVSLSGDTALIGAWLDDDKGDLSGSAYVFIRSGAIWTEQAKLLAIDGKAVDLFGCSV